MMATRIHLGLHGALSIGEDRGNGSVGNCVLDAIGDQLGCPVYDFPAATYPDPHGLSPVTDKAGRQGPVTSKALAHLIRRIEEVGDPSPIIRLFGWSTGAIMMCRVARDLKNWSRQGKKRPGKVDLCFAMDPLWSLAAVGFYPKIPANVRRWICVRQNRDGDRPPALSPLSPRFWQGVRLEAESPGTQYQEINVATGAVVGDPSFQLPTNPKLRHGDVPGLARQVVIDLLTA